jgi:hypothetical protein
MEVKSFIFSGGVWQEQRRFALQKLRDFGFGKRGLDGVIQDEAEQVVNSLLNDELNCLSEGPDGSSFRTVLIDSTFNVYVVNVLWQVVASRRFDPASLESRRMMERINDRFRKGYRQMRPFPELNPYLPLTEADRHMLDMKAMMRELIKEHGKVIKEIMVLL